jgi:tetratricopeptide (TPR) repeat protein
MIQCVVSSVFLLAALEPSKGPPPECTTLLDSGDACYATFDNFGALGYFQKAHVACPDDYAGFMKTVRALIDAGEDSASSVSESLYVYGARCADTLVQRFPDSAQSYFLRALAAGSTASLRNGARKVAMIRAIEADILRSIEKDPSFAPAYVALGRYYREVAQANPLLKAIARLFFGGIPKGTLLDSENFLRKALSLSPQNVYAHLELARTEAALHHRKESVELLEAMQTLPAAWHLDERAKKEGRVLLEQLRE